MRIFILEQNLPDIESGRLIKTNEKETHGVPIFIGTEESIISSYVFTIKTLTKNRTWFKEIFLSKKELEQISEGTYGKETTLS